MPGGRTPKPIGERRNRVAPVAPEVLVDATVPASFRPPDLPGGPWSPEVLRWWRAWCETPAAVQFSSTEWERLFRAAPLCAAFWVAVGAGEPREVRDAHAALMAAEKGLPATDWERRRNGIQVRPESLAKPAAGSPRWSALKVV